MAVPNFSSAGAGDDLVTELNLARALIEMGKKQGSSRKVNEDFAVRDGFQRTEATRLLKDL